MMGTEGVEEILYAMLENASVQRLLLSKIIGIKNNIDCNKLSMEKKNELAKHFGNEGFELVL